MRCHHSRMEDAGAGTAARKAERPQRRMQATRAIHRICYRNYDNIIIVIIVIRESMRVHVQPVVTVADQRAGWTGTNWQLVRYESAGRASALLAMDDDTTQTLDRASMWFRWPTRRYARSSPQMGS